MMRAELLQMRGSNLMSVTHIYMAINTNIYIYVYTMLAELLQPRMSNVMSVTHIYTYYIYIVVM